MGNQHDIGAQNPGDGTGVEELAGRVRSSETLPRLAIISDLFMELSCGGPLLLYRLFEGYPPERLLVVSIAEHQERRRDPITGLSRVNGLPGVRCATVSCPDLSLTAHRLWPAWSLVLPRHHRGPTIRTVDLVREFAPDAILTIVADFFWLVATGTARELGIPLHMIVWDDWVSRITSNRGGRVGSMKRWAARQLMGPEYRRATTRMCVSPGMAEQYQAWFGVDSTVLYPSRGDDSPEPRLRVRRELGGSPVVAFCGRIHQHGTAALLRELAAILATMNGRIDFYGPYSADSLAADWGLTAPVVRAVGFLPSAQMGEQVGRTAHALFLPASFELRERYDVATLFPSKLTDYTAIGLPVLVWGPGYSSAARWGAENPGATVCITDLDSNAVKAALTRLVTDPEYAAVVAQAGLEAGRRYFDATAARKTFLSTINPVRNIESE